MNDSYTAMDQLERYCFLHCFLHCFLSCLSTVVNDSYTAMDQLERYNKQACDILECRIEANLEEMGLTALCELPEDEPVVVEDFLALTEKTCLEAAEHLSK